MQITGNVDNITERPNYLTFFPQNAADELVLLSILKVMERGGTIVSTPHGMKPCNYSQVRPPEEQPKSAR